MYKTLSGFHRFCKILHAFRSANAGNVAITFVVASTTLIGGVGAAIDYSRANSLKASMQNALDATALMPANYKRMAAAIFWRSSLALRSGARRLPCSPIPMRRRLR